MLHTQIKIKIAKLEAIERLIRECESWMACYMIETEDGSLVKPLLTDDESSEYKFANYKAWEELLEILKKEVK